MSQQPWYNSSMRTSRKRPIFDALFLLAASVVAYLALRDTKQIMRLAIKVSQSPNLVITDYGWRTDEKLILEQSTKGKGYLVEVDISKQGAEQKLGIWTESQNENLTPFGYQISSTVMYPKRVPNSMIELYTPPSISPNGKKLLWRNGDYNKHYWDLREFEFSGRSKRHIDWVALGPYWFTDSKRWLEMNDSDYTQIRVLAIDGNSKYKYLKLHGTIGTSLVGLLPNDTLITIETDHPYRSTVPVATPGTATPEPSSFRDMYQFDLSSSKPGSKHSQIKLPMLAQVSLVMLSPKGDKLAWILLSERSPLGNLSNWPILRNLGVKTSHRLSIWVSAVDGSNFREVGHFPNYEGPSEFKIDDPIRTFQWLPSGKKLSFVHNDSLYTVPVD